MIFGCGVEYPAILCSGMIIFVCGDGTPGTEATMQFRGENSSGKGSYKPSVSCTLHRLGLGKEFKPSVPCVSVTKLVKTLNFA